MPWVAVFSNSLMVVRGGSHCQSRSQALTLSQIALPILIDPATQIPQLRHMLMDISVVYVYICTKVKHVLILNFETKLA